MVTQVLGVVTMVKRVVMVVKRTEAKIEAEALHAFDSSFIRV